MELRNLITFVQVAELGSFTKAAEQLGYSQSTISFQIKQLENELNCLLFERINHTITLTERGQELVSYAHQVRALTEDFKESLTKEQDCQGHIHIVAPDSVCEEMLNSCYLDVVDVNIDIWKQLIYHKNKWMSKKFEIRTRIY